MSLPIREFRRRNTFKVSLAFAHMITLYQSKIAKVIRASINVTYGESIIRLRNSLTRLKGTSDMTLFIKDIYIII